MSRGGPSRGGGGPGRGPSRGSGPTMNRAPSRGIQARPVARGGAVRRGGGGSIFAYVIVFIIIFFSMVISALGDSLLWILGGLCVAAIVGMLLAYKYKKDRAEAAETERLLNTDLEKLGSSTSELEDLASKYE